MNPVSLVCGFVPLVLFGLLTGVIPVAYAAAIAAVVAIAIAVVLRSGGLVLSLVQAVTLIVIAAIAFTGNPLARHFLTTYGGGIASLVLAAFMLITVPFAPFTARIARVNVPRAAWNSPRFISTNRHVSTAWGIVVLILGISGLISASVGHSVTPFQATLLRWGLPVLAVIFAIRFTKRTVANARGGQQEMAQPPRAY